VTWGMSVISRALVWPVSNSAKVAVTQGPVLPRSQSGPFCLFRLMEEPITTDISGGNLPFSAIVDMLLFPHYLESASKELKMQQENKRSKK